MCANIKYLREEKLQQNAFIQNLKTRWVTRSSRVKWAVTPGGETTALAAAGKSSNDFPRQRGAKAKISVSLRSAITPMCSKSKQM